MKQGLREPFQWACDARAVADQQRVGSLHRVSGVAVGDGLDVGVHVGVDRGGDRDPFDQVLGVVLGHRNGQDRLGVRAHELAQPVLRWLGSEPFRRQRWRSLFVPSGPAETTTPRARWTRRCLRNHAPRAHAFDLVALAAVGGPSGRISRTVRSGVHLRAPLLGEIEVVLHERVLGAVGASDHAATAQLAAGPVGGIAIEEGVAVASCRTRRRRPRRASSCRYRRRRAPRRARAGAGRPDRRGGSSSRRASAALRRSGARGRLPSSMSAHCDPRRRPSAARRGCSRSRGCRRRRRSRRRRETSLKVVIRKIPFMPRTGSRSNAAHRLVELAKSRPQSACRTRARPPNSPSRRASARIRCPRSRSRRSASRSESWLPRA